MEIIIIIEQFLLHVFNNIAILANISSHYTQIIQLDTHRYIQTYRHIIVTGKVTVGWSHPYNSNMSNATKPQFIGISSCQQNVKVTSLDTVATKLNIMVIGEVRSSLSGTCRRPISIHHRLVAQGSPFVGLNRSRHEARDLTQLCIIWHIPCHQSNNWPLTGVLHTRGWQLDAELCANFNICTCLLCGAHSWQSGSPFTSSSWYSTPPFITKPPSPTFGCCQQSAKPASLEEEAFILCKSTKQNEWQSTIHTVQKATGKA